MKFHHIITLTAVCLSLTSCFKDEPANAECDIEQAWIHFENPAQNVYNLTDTMVNVLYTDQLITFNVKRGTDISALAPQFTTTPGAKLVPANGSVQDFSHGPVTYTVTSEDGAWQRTYYVAFNVVTRTVADTLRFGFENSEVSSNYYYVWNDPYVRWDSGNSGYSFTGMATVQDPETQLFVTSADSFPTVSITDGYKGRGVKLTTRDTGPFGLMKQILMAAGNLFVGSFDATIAFDTPREATLFGEPFDRKPVKLKGHYKFKRGELFQDEDGNIIDGKTDVADIYAVFYRNHDENNNVVRLNGNDVKTSPYIIGMAQVTGITETDNWTEFEAEFAYDEEVDMTLLENRGYSLAIVFSSSVEGAYFRGAIGSTLMIDEVELICTDIQ